MREEGKNGIRPSLWACVILGSIIILGFGLLFAPKNKNQELKSGNILTTDKAIGNAKVPSTDGQSNNFIDRVKNVGKERQSQGIESDNVNLPPIEDRLKEALGIANQSMRHEMLVTLGREAAYESAELATKLTSMMAAPNSPNSKANTSVFVSNYVRESAKTKPSATADWIEGIHEMARGIASATLIKEWIQSDLPGASYWASTIQDDMRRNSLINTIGDALRGSRDIEYAASWAEQLGNTVDGLQNAGLIATLRTRTNPQGVFEWALNLPTPESRASAFGGFAEALVERDPALAKEWIQQFPLEEGIREHGENLMAYKWMQSDPSAANEWSQSETPHAPGVGLGK